MLIEIELLNRLIENLRDEKRRELRRKITHGDLQGGQMALGGEVACDELSRNLQYTIEVMERRKQEEDLRVAQREERKKLRQLERGAVKVNLKSMPHPGGAESPTGPQRAPGSSRPAERKTA